MDLITLRNNLKSYTVIDAMVDTLDELEDFIADLNRKQLAEGVNNENTQLGIYANFTIATKRGKSGIGGITDHVTLYGEGPFHKSIFSAVIGEELILDSKDSKLNKLENDWGDNILGLTIDSIKELRKKAIPLFWNKYYGKIFR